MTEKIRVQTIVMDACRRFPAMSSHGLAVMLFDNHRGVFNSAEQARDAVRYYRGQHGKKDRGVTARGDKTVHKVPMPASLAEVRSDYKLPAGGWLVMSDVHIPFHAQKPIEAAVERARDHKLRGLLFNGDIMDCDAVSFWAGHTKKNFIQEVETVVDVLDWFTNATDWKFKVWKPGNHEDRLVSYYYQHAPELGHQHAQIVDVLGLEGRGYEWLGRKQKIMAGSYLHILHGHELRKVPYLANPARWLFHKTEACAMCGHWHVTNQYTKNTIEDRLLTTWTTGCMCDLRPDYNPYGNEWNWGFAELWVDKKGDFEIENKRVLHNGKVV
jgi:hypothetical protein